MASVASVVGSAATTTTTTAWKARAPALEEDGSESQQPPPALNDASSWPAPDTASSTARGRAPDTSPAARDASESSPVPPTRRAPSRSKKQKWIQIAPAELQAAADAAAAAARQPPRRVGHQRSSSATSARGHAAAAAATAASVAAHRPMQAPPVPPLPASIDDVFVVRTHAQIHASTASTSSTASVILSTAGTHSTRATSPSSSLASLGAVSSSAHPPQKPSPTSDLSQLPSVPPHPDPHDLPQQPVSLTSHIPIPSRPARVVFGSIVGSLPSDDSSPSALEVVSSRLNQAETAPSHHDLVPHLTAMNIARAPSNSTGSTRSGSPHGEGGSSPALSASAGAVLSFFPDQPSHVHGDLASQMPQTPLELGWELPPATPWTPHSADLYPYESGSGWPRHRSSSSLNSAYQQQASRYGYSYAQSWDTEPYVEQRAQPRRDRKDRDAFEVDYSRRPRARDRDRDPSAAPGAGEGYAPRYSASRTRDGGSTTEYAPRARRNSFARGGGRGGGGGGGRSHSQPLDADAPPPEERGARGRGRGGRGRGGFRGAHHREEHGAHWYAARRPPSPEQVSALYWGTGAGLAAAVGGGGGGGGEGHPLPVPLTLLRARADGAPITPAQYFVLGQLEFYFGARNLQRDVFLRQQMDARGWVPLALVGSFKRLRALTEGSLAVLRDAAALSGLLETGSDDRVRLRDGAWEPWVLRSAEPAPAPEPEPDAPFDAGLPDPALIERRVLHDRGGGLSDADEEDEDDSDDDIVIVMGAGE